MLENTFARLVLKGPQNNLGHLKKAINPLQPGVAYLYPLKTSENLKVF